MARPVALGAILELSLVGRHAAQKTLNVLHYGISDMTGGPTVDGDLITDSLLNTYWNNLGPGGILGKYLSCISDDFTLERIRTQWIHPTRYSFTEIVPEEQIGAVVDPALPPNVSAVLGKRNESVGRHNRGSIHLPAVPSSWVENGLLTTASLAPHQELILMLKNSLNVTVGSGTATLRPLIFNQTTPADSAGVSEMVAMPTIRIVRRRTVGVGE